MCVATLRRFTEAPLQKKPLFAVVADGERGANVQCALRCGRFFVVLGLLVKINVGLVVVVFQKIRSFVETHAAGCAGRIYVPETGNVFGLFACFVGHEKSVLKTKAPGNVFYR